MDRASGTLHSMYRVLMRKNSVYMAFVLGGALAGERVVNYAVDRVWEASNKGKRYEDIKSLGTRLGEDEE